MSITAKSEAEYNWKLGKFQMAVVVSLLLWVVSIFFSVHGFSFNLSDWTGLALALVLSISITVIQLIGNDMFKEDSLFFWIWILAYTYGIATNTVGIAFWRSEVPSVLDWAFSGILGSIIEIVPEILLKRALNAIPDIQNKIEGLRKQQANRGSSSGQNRPTSTGYTPVSRPKPQNNSGRRPKDDDLSRQLSDLL